MEHIRILDLHVPEEATLIVVAGNLAVVVVAKRSKDVELYGSETIHAIKSWLRMLKL